MKNLTLTGIITLRSSLAHGAFEAAGLVTPFRREPIIQRQRGGTLVMDSYAIQSNDPEQLEMLRGYAQRILRIIWQSKSAAHQWTYPQLTDRVAVASAMSQNLGGLVHTVLSKMGATSPTFFNDDAEFLSGALAAMDNVMVLNLLRQPGERLLIISRMQAESQARYEKRDVPAGQLVEQSAGALKTAQVPYIPRVPVYSGNALRNGVVRRSAARFLLKRFGWYPSLDSFRCLFTGAALRRTGTKGIDIDQRRKILALMPIYGLLGGGFNQNNMIEGCAKSLKAFPIIREAKQVIHPDYWAEAEKLGMQDIMSVEANARRDDAMLLTGEFLGAVPAGDHPEKEKGGRNLKNTSMPYEREVIIAGTKLYTEWAFWHPTSLQIGAWVSAFHDWAHRSTLGGVASQGHGLADIEYRLEGDLFLAVRNRYVVMSPQSGDYLRAYEHHLDEHKAALKNLLQCSDSPPESDISPPESDIDVQELQATLEKEEQD